MNDLHRITWFNRVLLGVFAAGGVWCVVEGVWWFGVVFVGAALLLGVVIVRASRGRLSDTGRLDAVQPFDERERAASTWSFAVVGRAAIVALVAVFVAQVALRDGRADPTVAIALLALCVVWAGAIRVAVRRA